VITNEKQNIVYRSVYISQRKLANEQKRLQDKWAFVYLYTLFHISNSWCC